MPISESKVSSAFQAFMEKYTPLAVVNFIVKRCHEDRIFGYHYVPVLLKETESLEKQKYIADITKLQALAEKPYSPELRYEVCMNYAFTENGILRVEAVVDLMIKLQIFKHS